MGESSPQLGRYLAFGQAIADRKNRAIKMADFVDRHRFRAILPGTGWLSYSQFYVEIERRTEMFSDFGQNMLVLRVVEQPGALAIYYAMQITNDGALETYAGLSEPPSGKIVTITSLDMVRFDDSDKITELIIVSDRLTNIIQMAI